MQNGVQNTAGLTGFDHVGRQVIEDLGIGAQGIGQCRAAFNRLPHPKQTLLEERVLLVARQNFQTLHQGKAGIDHNRELAKENRLLLGLHRARADLDVEVACALLLDYVGLNPFPRQRRAQHLLRIGDALALHLFSG